MTTLSKMIGACEIQVKANGNERTFTAYGNVKNVRDHAGDVAVDGCYQKSIERHKANGTTPKLLWSHNPFDPPLGKIKTLEEDSKGLLFGGKISKTPRGDEIYELAKDEAIDQFSIGYLINQERWNSDKAVNELVEIDVKEISFVNFACNEESVLQDIKSEIMNGDMPTKRELQNLLRECGLSRKQASTIADHYNPETGKSPLDLSELKSHPLFQKRI